MCGKRILPMSIKYLLDAHLSPDIAKQGQQRGLDIVHVNEVGMKDALDPEIWKYCQNDWRCIVSVDARFRKRAEDAIADDTDIPGFFAVPDHLKQRNSIGSVLEILTYYHEALENDAADYETDVKNRIIWVS
jgi:uncharacterized protein DUF5615